MENSRTNNVFEENALPRKAIKEMLVRNARGRIALENAHKQIDRGKEDCQGEFNRARTGLLQRFHRTTSMYLETKTVCESDEEKRTPSDGKTQLSNATRGTFSEQYSWDTSSVRSQDISECSFSTTRASRRLRRSSSFTCPTVQSLDFKQSPSKTGRVRRNTFCSRPRCPPDFGITKRSQCAEVKPKEGRARSLSEVLPPVSLPPIHLQNVPDNRRDKKEDGLDKKTLCKKINHKLITANADELTKDLADCRYLRGNLRR